MIPVTHQATKEAAAKDKLRRHLLDKRSRLSPMHVHNTSEVIAEKAIRHIRPHLKSSIHLYTASALHNEVDTKQLESILNDMRPDVSITMGDPHPNAPFPSVQFDVIVVPVVGFDMTNYRIGMGGGWYDRWLATQSQAFTIGLAYDWAEVERVPTQVHDIPLDVIITNS